MRYFVKLDRNNIPVPNSLVFATKKPNTGRWMEIHRMCKDEECRCIPEQKPEGYYQKVKYYYVTDEYCTPIPGSNISAYCLPQPGNFYEFYPPCLINVCPPIPPIETVTVCGVTWMLKNLDVSHYADGTPIPESEGFYYNYDPYMGPLYGKMYTDVAINSPHGLAPEGWRLAGKDDWDYLQGCLGEEPGYEFGTIGDYLKTEGTKYWHSPNTGLNTTGLSIRGGGLFYGPNIFFGLKDITAMAYRFAPNEQTMVRFLFNSSNGFTLDAGGVDGCYVRCIKL